MAQVNRAKTLVVLGMHRSGTSCLAGCLRAGLGLGGWGLTGRDNPHGHHEDPGVVALNDLVLSFSGGSWRMPPARLAWNAELEARRERLVANWAETQSWRVVKDPRLLLTWPFWGQTLAGYPAVAITRHPAAVLDSLATRGDALSDLDALTLWIASSRALLSLVGAGVPLLEFNGPVPLPQQLEKLSAVWAEHGYEDASRAVLHARGAEVIDAASIHHRESNLLNRHLPASLVEEAESLRCELSSRLVVPSRATRSNSVTQDRHDHWRSHVVRAVTLASEGKVREAMQEFERAAETAPDPDALRQRSVEMAIQSGQPALALTACNTALATSAGPWWRHLQAWSLSELGRYEEALEKFDALLEDCPKLIPARRARLRVLSSLKRWSRVLDETEGMVEDEAPWIVAGIRAVALLRTGRNVEAESAQLAALTSAPQAEVSDIQLRWAISLRESGDLEAADSVYRALLAAEAPSLAAYMGRVETLQALGAFQAAHELADTACRAFPNDVWPQWAACALALHLRDVANARLRGERAAALAPEHPETQRLLAELAKLYDSDPPPP